MRPNRNGKSSRIRSLQQYATELATAQKRNPVKAACDAITAAATQNGGGFGGSFIVEETKASISFGGVGYGGHGHGVFFVLRQVLKNSSPKFHDDGIGER